MTSLAKFVVVLLGVIAVLGILLALALGERDECEERLEHRQRAAQRE